MSKRLTSIQAVARLNTLDTSDPEEAHALADEILLSAVPAAVAKAYNDLVDRCDFWATA